MTTLEKVERVLTVLLTTGAALATALMANGMIATDSSVGRLVALAVGAAGTILGLFGKPVARPNGNGLTVVK